MDFDYTPIQILSENLNNNTFYMKRDDLFQVSFGGNKARKATLFFEDIRKTSADCVLTYGASSSNHCRIIANIAASKRLPCYIISPIESSHTTTNSKLVNLFGASVEYCPVSKVKSIIKLKLSELKAQGYAPYFIQGGGHGNIGTQAYLNAYSEILKYERKSGVNFDYIFHTSGTGTTQSGLIVGKLINDDDKKIIGISNARKNPQGTKVIYESVDSYLVNRLRKSISSEQIVLVDDYVLDGYGSYNKKIISVIFDMLKNDGIPLDPIYTGKGYWGMKEYIKTNNISDKNILFIHTGGTPLFFDHLEELFNGY